MTFAFFFTSRCGVFTGRIARIYYKDFDEFKYFVERKINTQKI